ncbi:MAG: RNA polymerase sigma factor [Pirellulales bacterium]
MSSVASNISELHELEEIYLRLRRSADGDYRETWRLFAGNRRFQIELELAARRVLHARRLPRQRVPEVVNEALSILADRLHSRSNLGFDARYGKERFVAWIRAVARSHCRHALDGHRLRERSRADLDHEWAAVTTPLAALRSELADALETLTQPQRELVSAFAELGSIEAVAGRLGLSRSTAWRRFRAAVRRLRSRCRGEVSSGRLVGGENVAKKW